jgi:hypothetical protein
VEETWAATDGGAAGLGLGTGFASAGFIVEAGAAAGFGREVLGRGMRDDSRRHFRDAVWTGRGFGRLQEHGGTFGVQSIRFQRAGIDLHQADVTGIDRDLVERPGESQDEHRVLVGIDVFTEDPEMKVLGSGRVGLQDHREITILVPAIADRKTFAPDRDELGNGGHIQLRHPVSVGSRDDQRFARPDGEGKAVLAPRRRESGAEEKQGGEGGKLHDRLNFSGGWASARARNRSRSRN